MTDGPGRLLFASVHGCVDPSSGAAMATLELLEAMAGRGWECRALVAGLLDYEADTPAEAVLEAAGLAFERRRVRLEGAEVEVLGLRTRGVEVALLPTRSSRADRGPDRDESNRFVALFERALERFRPRAVLAYGGHAANLEAMRLARSRGVPVVFLLHNLAYADRAAFADAAAVVVPSEYARRHYARALGLRCVVVPNALHPGRVVAGDPRPRYATFVNPQPPKGAAVFARIARELQARRPEIPLLVVEGRGGVGRLGHVSLDLSGVENVHRMPNTADPRAFYGVSRVVLVPSLAPETFGRVAAEALMNGLPVLASDRGALPETLGDAGLVLPLPARLGAGPGVSPPTAEEVAPWIAALERLWDDAAWERDHRERALRESGRWDPATVAARMELLLSSLHRGAGACGDECSK